MASAGTVVAIAGAGRTLGQAIDAFLAQPRVPTTRRTYGRTLERLATPPPSTSANASCWRQRSDSSPRRVYGRDRLAYWRQVLESAEQADPAAPPRQRISEVEHAIADLQRRLRNQLLGLEDDDLKPEARRHITSRIAELEQAIADHKASLAKLHAELDIPMLATMPWEWCPIGFRCSGKGSTSCRNGSCGACSTAWI